MVNSSWLHRHRKAALLELSRAAGLPQDEDALKDGMVEALDSHLRANATRFASNATFDGYYGARSETPGRKRDATTSDAAGPSSDADVKSIVRGRGRRATRVKDELNDEDYASPGPITHVMTAMSATSSALSKRTPGRPRKAEPVFNPVPEDNMPPSPAVVTDAIEHQTTRMYAGLNDLITVSGVPETLTYLRDVCSSVVGVEAVCLLLEACGLQREILPLKYAGFDIPGSLILGTPSIPVKLPDLFILLTGFFWSTTTLWLATSLLIPLVFAYLFNLTAHARSRHGVTTIAYRHDFDPLAFNISKALFTWLVYSQGASFGLVSETAAERVNYAMFGGYNGVMIGAFIGMFASVYEAVQRK